MKSIISHVGIIRYIVGDQEEVAENVDPYTTAKWYDNYDYPATVYYQRTFAIEKWNTICLPLSLYNGSSSAKELTFAIDDGYGIREIATHIEGLSFYNGENVEANEVYNLSGTKVGKGTLDTLPKGIYILNGRKYVKR